MRIVHLTWGLGIGGLESMLVDISREQARTAEVWIIVGNRGTADSIRRRVPDSVRFIDLARHPGSKNPWYIVKLISKLRRIRPDVIHAHHESFGRLDRYLSYPMLLTIHNTRESLTAALDAFSAICCISEAVFADCVKRYPEYKPSVVVNGIPFADVIRKKSYGTDQLRLVQVGRLDHAQKGQDLSIRALRTLTDYYGEGRVQLDLIGDGPSLAYLKHLAQEYSVANSVHFRGSRSRDEIYEMLSTYSVLLQPSRFEGFGLSVVEGIAAGLPVVVSDTEGPREIVRDGALGWMFKSEDANDLAEVTIQVIGQSHRPGFQRLMHERIEAARSLFGVERTAAEYMQLYRLLANLGPSDSQEGRAHDRQQH